MRGVVFSILCIGFCLAGCEREALVSRGAVCGNGVVDFGEECDLGLANSNEDSACREDCMNSVCGDGYIGPGEQCDDGVGNSDTDVDACRTNCAAARCGDGVQDTDEDCDDGNQLNTDACLHGCTSARCGDGEIWDGVEECDSGVSEGTAECTSECLFPVCGDGVLDLGEECDNGELNSDAAADACRTNCLLAQCGDGVQDNGEQCDDGNQNNHDACLNSCTSSTCGDGVVWEGEEECDSGVAEGTATCTSQCRIPVCGDAIVSAGEECDEGQLNSDTVPDRCRTDCRSSYCGDLVTDSGEECDADNLSCTDVCTVAVCGDGMDGPGEECDDGAANSDVTADACRTDCSLPRCGDEAIDTDESCDDGNTSPTDGCSDVCAVESGWQCEGAPSNCTDINECLTGPCGRFYACTNSPGSYSCEVRRQDLFSTTPGLCDGFGRGIDVDGDELFVVEGAFHGSNSYRITTYEDLGAGFEQTEVLEPVDGSRLGDGIAASSDRIYATGGTLLSAYSHLNAYFRPSGSTTWSPLGLYEIPETPGVVMNNPRFLDEMTISGSALFASVVFTPEGAEEDALGSRVVRLRPNGANLDWDFYDAPALSFEHGSGNINWSTDYQCFPNSMAMGGSGQLVLGWHPFLCSLGISVADPTFSCFEGDLTNYHLNGVSSLDTVRAEHDGEVTDYVVACQSEGLGVFRQASSGWQNTYFETLDTNCTGIAADESSQDVAVKIVGGVRIYELENDGVLSFVDEFPLGFGGYDIKMSNGVVFVNRADCGESGKVAIFDGR